MCVFTLRDPEKESITTRKGIIIFGYSKISQSHSFILGAYLQWDSISWWIARNYVAKQPTRIIRTQQITFAFPEDFLQLIIINIALLSRRDVHDVWMNFAFGVDQGSQEIVKRRDFNCLVTEKNHKMNKTYGFLKGEILPRNFKLLEFTISTVREISSYQCRHRPHGQHDRISMSSCPGIQYRAHI